MARFYLLGFKVEWKLRYDISQLVRTGIVHLMEEVSLVIPYPYPIPIEGLAPVKK